MLEQINQIRNTHYLKKAQDLFESSKKLRNKIQQGTDQSIECVYSRSKGDQNLIVFLSNEPVIELLAEKNKPFVWWKQRAVKLMPQQANQMTVFQTSALATMVEQLTNKHVVMTQDGNTNVGVIKLIDAIRPQVLGNRYKLEEQILNSDSTVFNYIVPLQQDLDKQMRDIQSLIEENQVEDEGDEPS
jgi:hypothetical protein